MTIPETLDEKRVERDPIRQFQLWLDEAIAAKLPLPEAMNLATATPEGRPSSRMVLLKQVDRDGSFSSPTITAPKPRNSKPIPTRRWFFTGRS